MANFKNSKEDNLKLFALEGGLEAMKNNVEYQQVLKTLYKLQNQRVQAVERIEKLCDVKNRLIKNPRELVNALQKGENLEIPPHLSIAELPELEWDKYNLEEMINDSRPVTRKKNLSFMNNKLNGSIKKESENEKPLVVRGRVYDNAKPKSFNLSWTIEEQKKLEELLIKYPDELVSSRRYAKIAKELGTRTLHQVQSRIQKYFLILKRHGLPVPGKDPRHSSIRSAGRLHPKNFSRTSFMKAFDSDYNVDDNDSQMNNFVGFTDSRVSSLNPILQLDVSDEEDLEEDIRESEEYKELMKLKKIKKIKLMESETGNVVHLGYKCDRCGMEPIEGIRWHCGVCQPPTTIDFCSGCSKENLETISHSSSHLLLKIQSSNLEDDILAVT